MPLALDATYSLGANLSGVGVYSHEILFGLAAAHPDTRFQFCYRPHRYFKSFHEPLPRNAARFLLHDSFKLPLRCDLFHGLNQRMPARRLRRSVCTFHDLFVITGEYSTPEFRERFTRQARDAAERSDLIVAVSGFTAGQVHQLLGVERSRIRVVHHGVRAIGRPALPREPLILNVGAIQKRKNIERLVKAFERVPPEWSLVLAGAAGFGAAEILAGIERSPARERIQVTGYVSSDELARLYATASVFAFPSLDEGFGMPVLEAMACGVPVVAGNRAALPEVCGDAAVLVDPSVEEELSDALFRLTTDPVLRHTMIQRGEQRAAQFSWDKAVAETWSVYAELF